MNKRHKLAHPLVALAALLVVVGTVATTSHAWWRQLSVNNCRFNDSDYAPPWMNGNVYYNYASNHSVIYCPIPDDSNFRKTEIETINVMVDDQSQQGIVWSHVCKAYWNQSGGSCGSADMTSTSGVGLDTLSPSVSKLDDSSYDWSYLTVYLPPADYGFPSKMSGYTIED